MSLAVIIVSLALFLTASEAPAEDVSDFVPASINNEAVIIDVRSPEEFSSGHYPGAINIPHGDIIEGIINLAVKRERSIILYCRSGNRSGKAKIALNKAGFHKVENAGSLGTLIKTKEPTSGR